MRQRLMFESGVLPSDLDKQDYMELLRIQSAKSREDRPMNAADAHKEMAKMFAM